MPGQACCWMLHFVQCGFLRRLCGFVAVLLRSQAGLKHKGSVESALAFIAAIQGDLPDALITGNQKILRQGDPVSVDQGAEIAPKQIANEPGNIVFAVAQFPGNVFQGNVLGVMLQNIKLQLLDCGFSAHELYAQRSMPS